MCNLINYRFFLVNVNAFPQYEFAVDETDLDTLAQQLSRPASCCVLIKGTQQ